MKYHHHYLTLDPILYHRQAALPLENPLLVHFNHDLYERIFDIPFDALDWQGIIGGDNNAFADEFCPLAMVYAGHQFGQWAGQLGDGRGLLLTQVINKDGKLTDLHLKGSGRTPFSRFGDGRAMVDSTVREYLGGHALSSLGIKSSNALGFVVSDTLIARIQMVKAASLLRVNDCHVRFGHFEWIAAYQPKLFSEFTYEMLATYYPHLPKNDLDEFLKQVCQNTAKLIAHWQLIGFSHGVMNTDNLNITGSTLDFGPFGMMERFNPTWINNHSDHHGRYTYQNQPTIGHWNLQKWLSCFALLSIKQETMMASLDSYQETFYHTYNEGICKKLGLPHRQDSVNLAYEFVSLLKTYELDYTNSFRALIALVDNMPSPHEQALLDTLTAEIDAQDGQTSWMDWTTRYIQLIEHTTNKTDATCLMKQTNPVYILRNSMAQDAIDAVLAGDFGEIGRLFQLLKTPFTVQDIAKPSDTLPTQQHDMLPISCMS
ncbi:YdiU family protein [Moraxella haemolytica]|uniref:protein adenylyltransferase SelO family protein n=1 Tax=Moraxella TaxID=475 RepID=UPI002542890B|nr:protein adenylyltransferase SelO family protein [Moraxella sp. ZY171148]WII95699.1 YdiU family protein [Moraxella sp. ZY171148]